MEHFFKEFIKEAKDETPLINKYKNVLTKDLTRHFQNYLKNTNSSYKTYDIVRNLIDLNY